MFSSEKRRAPPTAAVNFTVLPEMDQNASLRRETGLSEPHQTRQNRVRAIRVTGQLRAPGHLRTISSIGRLTPLSCYVSNGPRSAYLLALDRNMTSAPTDQRTFGRLTRVSSLRSGACRVGRGGGGARQVSAETSWPEG